MTNKLIIPKITSILTAAFMLLIPCVAYGGSVDNPEYFGTVSYGSTYNAEDKITDSFYYSDEWFRQDPEVRNDALALVSMQLVAAAVDDDADGMGGTYLKKLGFEQIGFYGFDEEEPEGCNFTWGIKTVGSGEDTFTLAVIVIQSHSDEQTAKQTGWWQNFFVNGETITEEHYSYGKAADYALEGIKALETGGNVKYWITGQSRGGAIASTLAARLKSDENNVYAYTFEAPGNVEQDAVSDNEQEYGYIHDYVCDDDIVAMVPPWDMTRYGVEHRLNTDETTDKLFQVLEKMGSDAAEIAEDHNTEEIKELSTGLIRLLKDAVPSREEYSADRTDIFTNDRGEEIQIVYNYQDLIKNLMQVVFGNVFEGLDLDVIMDKLEEILPAVSDLYKAVKEESDINYYKAADGLVSFLEKAGIVLPLALEDVYALLKLAGPAMINPEFVPESETITLDELFDCLGNVVTLFTNRRDLIYSHQFDTIIGRLKVLAEEPAIESFDIAIDEPSPGDDALAYAVKASDVIGNSGNSWLTASASLKTDDKTIQNDKVYYLDITFDSVGHSIPEDFAVTVNGKEPVEPIDIKYADGVSKIQGTWEFVTGEPQEACVSFDMEGHGEETELIYVEEGSLLRYAQLPDVPEMVSDSTGYFIFAGWYDENGLSSENVYAENGITLHAKWIRLVDDIEIIYEIPSVGDEVGMPEVPDGADYEITSLSFSDEDWNEVTTVKDARPININFEIGTVSEEIPFLTEEDEDGTEEYKGVLTINGEEAEAYYDFEGNVVLGSYTFIPQ